MLLSGLNLLLLAILAYVIVDDLRSYRIRNVAVLALLAVSLASIVTAGGVDRLLPHAAFGLVGFVVLVVAYMRNLLGGGDAKLLSVAFLWTGPAQALLFALALLFLTLLYWAGARLRVLPHQRVDGRMRVPFGPSIAGAWIVTILASIAG